MSDTTSIVYLNGKYLPVQEACVSVLDRGFLLGDGVYEVIPVYGGNPFRIDQHLQRLENSLEQIRIPFPHTRGEWYDILEEIIDRNGGADQSIYLQVTRGVAAKRDHAFPETVHPTVFVMSTPLMPVSEKILREGVHAVTLEDIRWQRCDIKAITLLANVLLRQQALDEGCAEAILIRDGMATEGAASNLFIVRDGTVITPPTGPKLLPGITRDLILELAEQHDIPWREQDIGREDLFSAEEVWFSSSTREILPVIQVDERKIGKGIPGPVWRTLYQHYQAYKDSLRSGTA